MQQIVRTGFRICQQLLSSKAHHRPSMTTQPGIAELVATSDIMHRLVIFGIRHVYLHVDAEAGLIFPQQRNINPQRRQGFRNIDADIIKHLYLCRQPFPQPDKECLGYTTGDAFGYATKRI